MLLYQVLIVACYVDLSGSHYDLLCYPIKSHLWPNILLNYFLLYRIYMPSKLVYQLARLEGTGL